MCNENIKVVQYRDLYMKIAQYLLSILILLALSAHSTNVLYFYHCLLSNIKSYRTKVGMNYQNFPLINHIIFLKDNKGYFSPLPGHRHSSKDDKTN